MYGALSCPTDWILRYTKTTFTFYINNDINGLSVLSLNIQNIFSRFDTFYPVIKKLNKENLFFLSFVCKNVGLMKMI